MKREHELIMELCRFIRPDKEKIKGLMEQGISWPYVLGQLLFHRMGGAAYYILRECGLLGRVNREVRNSLKIIYDSGKAKTEAMKTALAEIAGILQNADFAYALLKGAYLLSVYPEGLRTSNDLDILICQKDISKLEILLKSAGFQQGHIRNGEFAPASRAEILSSRMNRGETVPFIRQVLLPGMDYLEIDINFSMDFKARQEKDTVAALLEKAEPWIETGGLRLSTLSPVDFLIHLCCHLYKEAVVYAWVEMERDLSLYKFADIYLLLDKWTDSKFYPGLAARIKQCGLERECYYALLRTKELFGIESPALDGLLAEIRPGSTRYLTEIIRPDQHKIYRYDEAFTEWLFISGRKGYLHEITNAIA